MIQQRGALWISAVLYISLSVVAMSLILSAAIPFVGTLKDRNTIIETKKLLATVDETIKTVANEGPGSQRELSPLIIGAGALTIDQIAEKIIWNLETRAIVQEPKLILQEGVLKTELKETPVEGKYLMELRLEYTTVNLNLTTTLASPFTGEYNMLVKHTGNFKNNIPEIQIMMG